MSFLGLTSQSPWVLNTAFFFGAFQIGLGVNGILAPRAALTMWGFTTTTTTTTTTSSPTTKTSSETRLTEAVMQLYGIRNVALGCSIFAVWWSGDSRTLGFVVLADSFVAFADGFVQKSVCGEGEWRHWSFLPVGWGLAGALMGLFD